jgi:hypothetical protein
MDSRATRFHGELKAAFDRSEVGARLGFAPAADTEASQAD